MALIVRFIKPNRCAVNVGTRGSELKWFRLIMTVAELFGCAFLAFGPPLSMIIFTIAHDPIRIIILIGAAFMWLLSLLLSSVVWFAMIPLREYIAFGLVCSVLIQVSHSVNLVVVQSSQHYDTFRKELVIFCTDYLEPPKKGLRKLPTMPEWLRINTF